MNQTKLPKAAAGLASLSSIQQASTWVPLGFLALCLPHSPLPSLFPALCLHCCPAAYQLGFPMEAAQFPSEVVF